MANEAWGGRERVCAWLPVDCIASSKMSYGFRGLVYHIGTRYSNVDYVCSAD